MQPETPFRPEQFLPPKKAVLRHVALITLACFILGPALGLLFFHDPRGRELSLSFSSLLVWGLACELIAAFLYVGWLIRRVRKAHQDHLAWERMRPYREDS